MAAYGALVSLTHLIDQVKLYHARRPIFTEQQRGQLESILEKVSFFQDFLEGYNIHEGGEEAEVLESRIVDAAYAAEDIFENHVVDDLHAFSIHASSIDPGERSSNRLSEGLQGVNEDMDSIKKAVTKIKESNKIMDQVVPLLDSLRHRPIESGATMVFGDRLTRFMDKLVGHQPNLQVIPITGMGGIGKTTFAKSIYENPYIVQYFDVRGWVTISQEYIVQQMLLDLLLNVNGHKERPDLTYHQLGEKLYKRLFGVRYLIVMDDIWNIEAWNNLKLFLPNNSNGSRVVITTRLSNVANDFDSTDAYKMNLLDVDESWRLLSSKVFAQECCPLELEEIGKEIASSCKGLPLSISTVGGLLAKSNMTREYWEHIAKSTSRIVNSEDNERCLKILHISYRHLPVYLKPCFLYMGVFQEDEEIRISNLIKLWVAEGFLKPNKAISLEEVAEDYLKDLIDRNLIFVSEFGYTGNMKFCKIHDLLRDLCIREAEKERFLCITKKHKHDVLLEISCHRRIAVHNGGFDYAHYNFASDDLQTSCFRSVICSTRSELSYTEDFGLRHTSSHFKLLRVLKANGFYSVETIFQLVNSRYLYFRSTYDIAGFPSSLVHLLWNLQTLYINGINKGTILPSKIWEMQQLRHVRIYNGYLPDTTTGLADTRKDCMVLENLQTLSEIIKFRCTEEVLQRVPNIRVLKLDYEVDPQEDLQHYRLKNLCRLAKLQSLQCWFPFNNIHWQSTRAEFSENVKFPLSLKKLTLANCYFHWEDVATKIGSLPHLEKLVLFHCFIGKEWSTADEQFPRLRFLKIMVSDLECWIVDNSTHFPRLEHLFLKYMNRLKEIPSCIGDIATLRVIELEECSKSVVDSAVQIVEEQHGMGNEDLRLLVRPTISEDRSKSDENG